MMNMDHPLHDEDPYNDGSPDTDDTDAECLECGYDILSPGRELCDQCFQDYHGPDNDKDYEFFGLCKNCGDDMYSPGPECGSCREATDGPGDDKDLDPESIGGYTYDIQAIKDTQEGT
jgi:hypothetical protein